MKHLGKPSMEQVNVHSMKLVSLLAVALACLFALVLVAGCASQSSPSADDATPEQASDNTVEQDSGSADDSEGAANEQEATDEEMTSTSNRPSEEEIAQYNEWADTLVFDALNNLAHEGVIARPASDGEYLDQAFEYTNYSIAFLDEEAGEELCGSFVLPAGKVVIADFDPIVSDAAHSTEVFYANHNWGPDPDGEPTLFYPQSMFGMLDQYEMQDALTDVPIETFANSTDECDYLIAFDGVASRIEEEYYMGGWDRVSVTTLVLIIDAKQGKVVHIENLGSDTPDSVRSDRTEGDLLRDKLTEYLHELLLNQSSN